MIMKKQTEAQIQKDITDYLESRGHYVIKIVRGNKSGISDLAICADGRFIAIEVKAVGKRVSGFTHLQKHHHMLVRQSGGKAFVADSVYDCIEQGL